LLADAPCAEPLSLLLVARAEATVLKEQITTASGNHHTLLAALHFNMQPYTDNTDRLILAAHFGGQQ
jgi:hypothetical protein